MRFSDVNTEVEILGPPSVPSPLLKNAANGSLASFVGEDEHVIVDVNAKRHKQRTQEGTEPLCFELAGPREQLFFDPAQVKAGLVTCGGLCPGLNDIIRAIVLELYHCYHVKDIFGFRHGLQGFIPSYGHEVIPLGPKSVATILDLGGTILGSSRGPQNIDDIVTRLDELGINILFMIGGDGTLVAALKIAEEVSRRGLPISVIGIPKTIDNDIYLLARSFGFDTAVGIATRSIEAAHNEARGYVNGIGLIKLMGRESGFIAASTSLARQDVNFVLIPEIDFDLEGPSGFLDKLEQRLTDRKHAVIVVAEGAGQKFFGKQSDERDPSGNPILHDIGTFLKQKINEHFSKKGIEIALKYIDPSYIIRSLPANPNDRIFCSFLGRDAVHAGMAGKTKLFVGSWNNHFVHVPISASAGMRKQVETDGKLWRTVLEATGQGSLISTG